MSKDKGKGIGKVGKKIENAAKKVVDQAKKEYKKVEKNVALEWNKLNQENKPAAKSDEVKVDSDCAKFAEHYLQISQLKGNCEKSQVEVLIASLDKIGVSAPELILFSNDLKNSEYSLTVKDCAWFDGQVELYSNKLVECAKGDISHEDL